MSRPLRVLLVEDSAEDATIVLRELRKARFDVLHERVDNADALLAALRRQEWDIILSDFSMPEFNGIAAFEMVRNHDIDVPFIFVSGRIGEDRAAEAMKRGASDYILKDKLARLGPAIERELQDSETRRQRHQMAQQLKENEELYRSLVESSFHGIGIHQAWRLQFVNHAFAAMFGYGSPQEVLQIPSLLEMVADEHRERVEGYYRIRMSGAEAPEFYEFEGLRKDGSRIWLESTAWVVPWKGQTAIQFAVTDITQRKHAEQALIAQQHLLETVITNLPMWVSVNDRDGRFLLVNRAYGEAAGLPPEEMLGKTMVQLGIGTPGESEIVQRLDKEVLESGIRRDDPRIHVTTGDGKKRTLRVIRAPIPEPDGRRSGLLSLAEDVTEKIQLEEEFRQAQKLESIGRLAGGVAHDFNNMLAVILSYSDGLVEEFEESDRRRGDLIEIRDAAKRAAGLTRQLLTFSRKQVLELRPVNLSEVTANLESFLGRMIGEDVRLRLSLDAQVPLVMADVGQIEQVIMNLAVNARDAMPDGGELLIEVSQTTLDESHASQHLSVSAGAYVQLAVTDSGTGIAPEHLERIFEPFFTTKGQGKGTGLGLATIYGIVKQLQGGVWLYSEIGKGTTFKIYLPVTRSEGAAPGAGTAELADAGGSETILLVEDDAAVRRAAIRILESAGYDVLPAASGEEALMIIEARDRSIDLLITDVIMPGMGGKVLADRFSGLVPQSSVIFMSGYTENAIANRGVLEQGTHLIQKPFSKQPMLRKIREVLNSRRG